MNNLTITINDREFPLSTTLRVAFVIQGQHGHKSYIDIFQKMGEMTVEQQIGILWASFQVANPEEAKTITQTGFQNYCLDHMNLKDLMDRLQAVSEAMMGKDEDKDETKAEVEDPLG